MAGRALVIAFLATFACLVHVEADFLMVTSTFVAKDGKGEPVATYDMSLNVTGNFNKTSDMSPIDQYVDNQLAKLVNNPEQFAEKKSFGLAPPSLKNIFKLKEDVTSTVGSTTTNIQLEIVYSSRGGQPHEKPFAFKPPSIF